MLLKPKADARKIYRLKEQLIHSKNPLVPVTVKLERILRAVEGGKRAPGP